MTDRQSPGTRFKAALAAENPLQIVGTINAYCALLAERAGFRAIYLSGGGIANASFGLPDLGVTTLDDVAEDVRRITDACPLPLLVDADTGFGPALVLARTVRRLGKAGAAGMHIEDQVQAKRCGHRPGKALVAVGEMQDRLKAATDARSDGDFVIMARTDAYASEGLERAIARARSYIESGADMIFAEALPTLDDFRAFTQSLDVPVLANITEFGRTPLLTREELATAGVRMILYPLSAFRAMSLAAAEVYATIRSRGTQRECIDRMQTREELYEVIGYHEAERALDALFSDEKKPD